MFEIDIPYPSYRDEFLLATERSGLPPAPVRQVLTWDQLAAWRSLALRVATPASVVHYAVRLVRATRVHEGENPDFVYEWVSQGVGPRGSHFLVLAAKVRATLWGRSQATHEDVRAVCLPVLRHRIHTNQNARANGIRADRVVRRLLEEVPPRVLGDDVPPREGEALTFHDWIPADGGGELP
jgi:MoxR-like ATPase